MAESSGPSRSVLSLVSGILAVAGLLAGALFAWLLIDRLAGGNVDAAAIAGLGLLGVALVLVVWFAAVTIINQLAGQHRELARQTRAGRSGDDRQAQLAGEIIERLDGLAHWAAMSETTRSLLVRKREVDVFCRQIQSTIDEGDWDEADHLIRLFDEHFQDDEMLRKLQQQLSSSRDIADDEDIRQRIAEIRNLIDEHNFPAAELSLNRLAKEHAGDRRLDDLRATFVRARRRESEAAQQRFAELLADGKLEQAAGVLDEMTWIDGEVVKELRDQWKARFREAQLAAKEQFRLACREKQWARALSMGERILSQFADTSLAGEVRRVIDGVRDRAKAEADTHHPTGQSSSGNQK